MVFTGANCYKVPLSEEFRELDWCYYPMVFLLKKREEGGMGIVFLHKGKAEGRNGNDVTTHRKRRRREWEWHSYTKEDMKKGMGMVFLHKRREEGDNRNGVPAHMKIRRSEWERCSYIHTGREGNGNGVPTQRKSRRREWE